MKAITIKQPWAYLICAGIKDIENRSWKTNFRGRVLIHAGKGRQYSIQQLLNLNQKQVFDEKIGCEYDFVKTFPKGAIIGSVEIVDCVINHPSIWAEKSNGYSQSYPNGVPVIYGNKKHPPIYNWVLANPILYPKPIENIKGKLSFWEYSSDNLEISKIISTFEKSQ